MAGSSAQSTPSVGVDASASDGFTVVRIVPTKRDPKLFQHFDLCELSNGLTRARCKACGHFLKGDSNSNLRLHLSQHCKAKKNNPGGDQTQIGASGGIWNFDPETVREMMGNFVIQESLPFDHFDNPRLTRLIQQTLQPRYHHVSRTTLRADCVKRWKQAKKQLILGFQNLNTGVNLTTDVWSAPHGLPDSYLCVTAHWVSPDTWQMMKRTIAFEMFEYPHDGENLFYILDSVIQTYGLQGKIFSISFDNASNNTSAVQKLKLKYQPLCNGIFFHTRCVAHIINLVVQDGLNVQEIKQVREDFRQMLKDVFMSGKKRYTDYRRFCRDTSSLYLGANWDVPTRWNSTWKMFDSATRQRASLEMFHDGLAQQGLVMTFPTPGWECVKKLTDLLETFKTATTYLSGVYYPTSNLVLHQLHIMCEKLNEFEFEGELYENMIGPMKEKFRKYFTELPAVFTCATALNPFFNAAGVETVIDDITHALNLDEENCNFFDQTKERFNIQFQSLYEVYFQKYGSTTSLHDSTSSASGSSSTRGSKSLNLFNTLRNVSSKRAKSSLPSSELGRYKGTDFISTFQPEDFETFDILAWWKDRESQFPVLAAMARDLLSVQASTVASESAFSLSGRVLSIRRTRLTPTSLEVCICLKDHLDAMERVQNVSNLEGEIEVEAAIHEEEVEMGESFPLSDEELQADVNQANARAKGATQ